jgi:hypothetical protein
MAPLEHVGDIREKAIQKRKTTITPHLPENGFHGFRNFLRLLCIDHMRVNHAQPSQTAAPHAIKPRKREKSSAGFSH